LERDGQAGAFGEPDWNGNPALVRRMAPGEDTQKTGAAVGEGDAMSGLQKGLLVGAAQLLIVLSLGAKLRWDRARLPRVWVKTVAYDPDSPVRGRYLSLRLEVDASDVYAKKPIPEGTRPEFWRDLREVELAVENGRLVAHPGSQGSTN